MQFAQALLSVTIICNDWPVKFNAVISNDLLRLLSTGLVQGALSLNETPELLSIDDDDPIVSPSTIKTK